MLGVFKDSKNALVLLLSDNVLAAAGTDS